MKVSSEFRVILQFVMTVVMMMMMTMRPHLCINLETEKTNKEIEVKEFFVRKDHLRCDSVLINNPNKSLKESRFFYFNSS